MPSKSVSKMTAKMRHKLALIEYMSNPDNIFPKHSEFAGILGIDESTLYRHFTPSELQEIDSEALLYRRARYTKHSADIDRALVKECKNGNPQAIKLFFQRFENWSEKTKLEHEITGIDDIVQDIEHN